MSPTQKCLAELRREGYVVAIVEKFNSFVKIRQDMFGFIDILAIRPGEILGVQASAATDHQKHVRKCKAHPNLPHWLAAGGKFEVWSIRKSGARGKRKVWTIRREPVAP